MKKSLETWLPIPGYQGYEVSDFGHVRSFVRNLQGVMLCPGKMSGGHLSVALGRGKTRTVHSLVMLAFVGPPPDGLEIRHLNGIHTDNRRENLCYGTRSENIQDKKWHTGFAAKHSLELVQEIKRQLVAGISGYRIAKDLNLAPSYVYAIRSGKFHTDVFIY